MNLKDCFFFMVVFMLFGLVIGFNLGLHWQY